MKSTLLRTVTLAGTFAALMFSTASFAELAKKRQTPQGLYLTAAEAYDFVKKNREDTVFIDVRTRGEVNFLGMPTIADANIPYMMTGGWTDWNAKKHTFKLVPNSNFLPSIEKVLAKKGLDKDGNIVLMCRSGSRSAKAAALMDQAGYKNVYSITDGYEGGKAKKGPQKGQRVVNGWKNADLPWSYKLKKQRMYWEL